jgi:outer membrane lipoprotein-sorting protein
METSRFNFAARSGMPFRGLAIAIATLLLAGCQESPATNGTPAGAAHATNETVAPGAAPAGAIPPARQSSEPQTADDVLKKMFEVYRECRSYRDTGVMKSAIRAPVAGNEKTENFTTCFKRPDRYRFTKSWMLDGKEEEQVIWRSGAEFQIRWNTRPNLKPADSLETAIGLGHPQSEITAAMLMADVKHSLAGDTVGHKLAGDDAIDGRACWQIDALTTKQQPAKFWIDKQSFLLRQFRHSRKAGEVLDERTITWQPEINVEIPDSALQLDPPAAK